MQKLSRNTKRNSNPSLGSLVLDMQQFFLAGLSPNTRSSYRSGLKSYLIFCKQISCEPFPVLESTLQLFVTSLAKRVAYSTIKVYLCGVQYENLVCGFNNKISQKPRLYYVLRGIRRTQGSIG